VHATACISGIPSKPLPSGRSARRKKLDREWRVNAWVKQGILLGFRLGELEESGSGPLSFVDKDTFPADIQRR